MMPTHEHDPDRGGGSTRPSVPVGVAYPPLPIDYDGHPHDEVPQCAR